MSGSMKPLAVERLDLRIACKEDLSATLEMTTTRNAIKTPRRFIIFCAAPPPLNPLNL